MTFSEHQPGRRLHMPSGEVIDIVRLRAGRYLEHWGINTLASVLAALKAP